MHIPAATASPALASGRCTMSMRTRQVTTGAQPRPARPTLWGTRAECALCPRTCRATSKAEPSPPEENFEALSKRVGGVCARCNCVRKVWLSVCGAGRKALAGKRLVENTKPGRSRDEHREPFGGIGREKERGEGKGRGKRGKCPRKSNPTVGRRHELRRRETHAGTERDSARQGDCAACEAGRNNSISGRQPWLHGSARRGAAQRAATKQRGPLDTPASSGILPCR